MASEFKHISTPLTDEVVEGLSAGDNVLLSGVIYTARDAAHKRLVELLDKGEELPFDLRGQVIYYVGPTPARPGKVIGAAGPTTSGRMNPYAPRLLAAGQKGIIGKGEMDRAVQEALERYKAVYFAAIGGAGALIAQCVVSSELVAYEDLGPEAIRRLVVRDLPLTVAQDCHGGNLYQEGRRRYQLA
ncbi:MAG: Fe-S-containing hydro-lyase [candidate division KSB1 bacterium]|nr:Fe-S-containing hydro-lyase [candidate division KSB1 bacterium]